VIREKGDEGYLVDGPGRFGNMNPIDGGLVGQFSETDEFKVVICLLTAYPAALNRFDSSQSIWYEKYTYNKYCIHNTN